MIDPKNIPEFANKSKVGIVGNLSECQFVFENIRHDFVDSIVFLTNDKDIEDGWFEDKTKMSMDDVNDELKYDFILIASKNVDEFFKFKKELIGSGLDNKKIWYNCDINDFNLRLMGFTNYNSGKIKYKKDYFIKKQPSASELRDIIEYDSMNRLEEYFYTNTSKPIDKVLHYFEIYDRHFGKFVGKEVNVLEIGVFKGGSLELWRDYFGSKCKIYGIDISPRCKRFESDQIEIFTGDVEDREFLRSVKEEIPKIDVLIDDGGHMMNQLIVAFEELYPHISEEGVYLAEDLGTSYREDYDGGYKKENTFIEYSKNLIDRLNAWFLIHGEKTNVEDLNINDYTLSTHSMHYYTSVLVIEKRKMNPGLGIEMGDDMALCSQTLEIQSIDPADGAELTSPVNLVTVTFNEEIKEGNNFWIELNNHHKSIPITKSINNDTITITPKIPLAPGRYSLILHTGCITDQAGNPFALKTSTFTINPTKKEENKNSNKAKKGIFSYLTRKIKN